ncbi:unnamed protein product, partial [Aphanomyces euteiches]
MSLSERILADSTTQKWLDELNANPEHLYVFIAERKHKHTPLTLVVNKYFMSLLEFWLRCCPTLGVDKLVAGQQLIAPKSTQTVGQLKFVFSAKFPGHTIPVAMHWEASIKFFLFCGSLDGKDDSAMKLENFVAQSLGENLAWRADEVQRKLEMCRLEGVRSWLASHFGWQDEADQESMLSYMILRGTTPTHALFAILPKVYWLSTVSATRASDGQVWVPGDEGLKEPPIEAMERNRFFALCKEYFSSKDTAMPLFIAELHPVGDGSSYVEVSRGSIMNSKTWNPDPLMQTATRFKRDNLKSDSLDAFHQRKYEQRRPVDLNGVRLFKSEVKSFDDVSLDATWSPIELVEKLRELMKSKHVGYVTLKKAVEQTLKKHGSTDFIVQCLKMVLDDASTEVMDTFRLGHMLLEAYTPKSDGSSLAFDEDVISRMEAGPESWWAIRFQIKALSKLFPNRVVPKWVQTKVEDSMWQMLSSGRRWNATAVDVCVSYDVPRDEEDVQRVLQVLISSQDYVSAEAFVVAQLKLFGKERAFVGHAFIHDPSTPAKASRRIASLVEPFAAAVSLHGDSNALPHPIENVTEQRRRLLDLTCVEMTSVRVVDTEEGAGELLSFVQALSRDGRHVVGMDCEWRPANLSQADSRQVEVLQLAFSGGVVFVLDCAALSDESMERVLHSVMNAKNILLSGFSVAGDVQRLRAAYPSLECLTNCVEVRRAAVARVGNVVQTWGLAALASTYLGIEVAKDQQVSDWAYRPLSSEQVAYAAMDAHCARLLLIYFVLDLVESVEPLVKESQHIWTPWLMRERNLSSYLRESDVAAAVEELGLSGKIHSNVDDGVGGKTVAFVSYDSSTPHYFAVVVALSKTIDMELLSRAVGCTRLALASDADLLHVFGYIRGCIGPIGLRQQSRVTVVLDAGLLDEPAINCGAGGLGRVVSLNPRELLGLSSVLSI